MLFISFLAAQKDSFDKEGSHFTLELTGKIVIYWQKYKG